MRTSRSGLLTTATSILVALSLHVAGHAATIAWGQAKNIVGDTDVINTGTVVGAFNVGTFGVPSTTVNGVTFAPFAFDSNPTIVGNFRLDCSNYSPGNNNTVFGSASAPFSSLSSSYQTLLQSGPARNPGLGTFTLTMSGLTTGQNYTFQWWANDSALFLDTARVTEAESGGIVDLDDNIALTQGGVGQYAVGTFTADSSIEVISFTEVGPGSEQLPLINAFQLRTVPEPSTWAMLGFGSAALLVFRRRRKKPQSPHA